MSLGISKLKGTVKTPKKFDISLNDPETNLKNYKACTSPVSKVPSSKEIVSGRLIDETKEQSKS